MSQHIIETELLDNLGAELKAIGDTLSVYEIRLRDGGKSETADRIFWRRHSLSEYRQALKEIAAVSEAAQ